MLTARLRARPFESDQGPLYKVDYQEKMPKAKSSKKAGARLKHESFTNQLTKSSDDIRPMKSARKGKGRSKDDEDGDNASDDIDVVDAEEEDSKLVADARKRLEEEDGQAALSPRKEVNQGGDGDGGEDSEDDYEDDVLEEDDDDDNEDLVKYEGTDYVGGANLSQSEEDVVNRFLHAGQAESRTLADIILEKMNNGGDKEGGGDGDGDTYAGGMGGDLPSKVIEVYTSVGNMLAHYRSGKLPRALKMLPHIKDWENILWITRPDTWSPTATYACTRIFASNLNAKMAQRFYNLVLLEKCRDDIRENNKLNYHLYMSLKKSLFKPAAFYKGILLPLAQSGNCTLREATIFGSVLAKVSIPGIHSAAALLRLTQMPYSGSTSMFIRILLNKKYSLPRRVIDALVDHFVSFEREKRVLPVVWHQSLLVFAQRYKLEVDDTQRARLKSLMKIHAHHQITPEVRRELFNNLPQDPEAVMRVE